MTREEMREHCNAYGYSDGEVGAFKDGYQKGRADAIDELIIKFKKRTELRQMNKNECIYMMYDIAEELKEQK